jgi:hypothetical protein
MIPQNNTIQTQGLSLETTFVGLYVNSLMKLQDCWFAGDKLSKEKFDMQIDYLISLLPDREKRLAVMKEQSRLRKELTDIDPDDANIEQRVGLVVVSSLVEFLTESFGLIHSDIIGPATDNEVIDLGNT